MPARIAGHDADGLPLLSPTGRGGIRPAGAAVAGRWAALAAGCGRAGGARRSLRFHPFAASFGLG